jgi:hypothetical protein
MREQTVPPSGSAVPDDWHPFQLRDRLAEPDPDQDAAIAAAVDRNWARRLSDDESGARIG